MPSLPVMPKRDPEHRVPWNQLTAGEKADRLRRVFILGVIAVLALVVAVACAGMWMYYTTLSKNIRRDEVDTRIDTIACLIIGGTPDDPKRPIIHDFRVKYHCPKYDPASVKKYGQPQQTVTKTRTVTATPGRPGAAARPSAAAGAVGIPTPSRTPATGAVRPGAAAPTPAPPGKGKAAATRTVVRTTTASPAPTTPGLLAPICQVHVAGIAVC